MPPPWCMPADRCSTSAHPCPSPWPPRWSCPGLCWPCSQQYGIRWQSSGKTLAGLGPEIIFTTVHCTPPCTSKPYNIFNLKSQTVVTLTAMYTTILSMYLGTLLHVMYQIINYCNTLCTVHNMYKETLWYFKSQITNCCKYNPPCTVHNTTFHVLGSLMLFQISNHKLL